MRVVVDTNIVISAVLNTNSRIASIMLKPRTGLNFYSTEHLLSEVLENKEKIKKISGLTEAEFSTAFQIITKKIRFINVKLIPLRVFRKAELLTKDIDIDDTEFVALAEHTKAKFWTGDKVLIEGLKKKKWNKFISTEALYKKIQ